MTLPDNVTFPTLEGLATRQAATVAKGYPPLKWIEFMTTLMRAGLAVGVYEAVTTRSKYVYVVFPDRSVFKVRFSNHRPNKAVQGRDDSDFYVGVSNGMVTTTDDALRAVARCWLKPIVYPADFPDLAKEYPRAGKPKQKLPWPTAAEKAKNPPHDQRVFVPYVCDCGNTWTGLLGAKRRCKQCGKHIRGKLPEKQGETT